MPDAQPAPDTATAAQPAAATSPVTPAPHAVPVDPNGPPATLGGVPLTVESSYEDLLRADPPPAQVQSPPQEVHEIQGRPAGEPASATPEAQGDTPTSDEPPPADTPAEAPEPQAEPFDEDKVIERLAEQKRGLLREQGKKNQELGDLRRQVRELQEVVQQVQAAPPQTQPPPVDPADLAARLLDNPAQFLLTPQQAAQIARQEAAALLQQQAAVWQEQQDSEAVAIAPEVGKDLFLQRHGITSDFDSWCATDEGKAVNALFERDANRSRLLEAYRDDADPKGIANVLTKALEAHRIGKKAAQGRATQNGEKARIDASRPPSAPVRTSPPPPPVTREKSIFDPWDESDLANFLRNSPPYVNP